MSQLFNSEFAEVKSDVKLLADYSGNFGRGLRKDVDKVASESKLVGSRSKSWLLSEINQRLVQISIFASTILVFTDIFLNAGGPDSKIINGKSFKLKSFNY